MLARKLSGNNELCVAFSAISLCVFENVVNSVCVVAVCVYLASIPDGNSYWYVPYHTHTFPGTYVMSYRMGIVKPGGG
jgi:hypothetical protein